MLTNFTITKHVLEQYVSRFVKVNHYAHLNDCKRYNCEICNKLKKELANEAIDNYKDLKTTVRDLILDSDQDKSVYNNSNYMNYLYEKYGYECTYEFYLNKNGIVFVCKCNCSERIFLTCYSTVGSKFSIKKKFKKNRDEQAILS